MEVRDTSEAYGFMPRSVRLAKEADINKCPSCGGIADNGFDRCLPPNPYCCTKCDSKEAQGAVGIPTTEAAQVMSAASLMGYCTDYRRTPIESVEMIEQRDAALKAQWERK